MTLPKIATITLNPAIDQTAFIPDFRVGEVNRVQFEQSDPGGKGINVASFLTDFGHKTLVTGFLGADNAEIFAQFFALKHIEDCMIRLPGKTRVNVKIVDRVQARITDVNFPGQPVPEQEVEAFLRAVDDLTHLSDWFVISGSLPAGVPASIYKDLVTNLKAKGKLVVLDASGDAFRDGLQSGPYAVKANREELQEWLGQHLETETDILRAGQELLAKGIEYGLISMGAAGAIFIEGPDAVVARPPEVEVKSTVGAGDAMVAGFIVARLRGDSLADCARLATAFSVATLGQLGPRLPGRDIVESLADKIKVQRL